MSAVLANTMGHGTERKTSCLEDGGEAGGMSQDEARWQHPRDERLAYLSGIGHRYRATL